MDFSADYYNGDTRKLNDTKQSNLIGINECDLLDFQNANAYYQNLFAASRKVSDLECSRLNDSQLSNFYTQN